MKQIIDSSKWISKINSPVCNKINFLGKVDVPYQRAMNENERNEFYAKHGNPYTPEGLVP